MILQYKRQSNLTSRSNYVVTTQAKFLITSVLHSEDCSLLENENTHLTKTSAKPRHDLSLKITLQLIENFKSGLSFRCTIKYCK